MKLRGPGLSDLGMPRLGVPRLGLASFRRRILIRLVFLVLAVATLALAVVLLQDEKARSYRNYQQGFRSTQADVMTRLRQPAGQLALMNASSARAATALRPLVLPYPSLDIDDLGKVQQSVDVAGCSFIYPDESALCVGLGSSANVGRFLYLVGSFNAGELAGREEGELDLPRVHHARIRVDFRGGQRTWVAPFERLSLRGEPLVRGRFAAFTAEPDGTLSEATRAAQDLRAWVTQSATCAGGGEPPECQRRVSYAMRLPFEALRQSALPGSPNWPPPDMELMRVQVSMVAPGGLVLFDSDWPGAVAPPSLQDLQRTLEPGEVLTISREGPAPAPVAVLRARDEGTERSSPLIVRLIDRLPVADRPAALTARETIATPLGNYVARLDGDARGIDRGLSVIATRMSWYVAAMLAAITLAWAVVEVGLIRRIVVLTRRAAAVSHNVQKDSPGSADIAQLDVSDLRGADELGILAGGLSDLLQRVKSDVHREQLRAQHERDMLQAVGHEILSPLQSLMVLHPDPAEPAHRYVQRMQQAVRVLYGHASPSEALAAAQLQLKPLDLDAFLREVAENASFAGIEDVRYVGAGMALVVRADPFSLEDVVTHILRNAQRHRTPGTPITITLHLQDRLAVVHIHNIGPAIPTEILGRIFEYGVGDAAPGDAEGRRGQGLFVVRTYMAKMAGSVKASNRDKGVIFELSIPLDG
jgi:two-component system, OmpR family, sensor kinase